MLLRKGDLLVFNDARVIPARFTLQKPTRGRIEGLFISQAADGVWNVLLKNLGSVKPEMNLQFVGTDIIAHAVAKLEEGQYQLKVDSLEPAISILNRIGRMPLPPYIKREKEIDSRDDMDRQRYQTVYAQSPGSIAAPTAGLHFTTVLLDAINQAGIERTNITLHVGLGTFKPVAVDRLEDHAMHVESYSIDQSAADALNRAKAEKRRIVAIGTTSARVLESQPANELFRAKNDETSIFIYPPYQWKHVNALVTNFHLPRSTLIALVAATIGIEEQKRVYQVAIEERYRFFSYGDAMLIE